MNLPTHGSGAASGPSFGPPTLEFAPSSSPPPAAFGANADPLAISSRAVRESRRWAGLFGACTAGVVLWMTTGDLSVWPSLVGFASCTALATWEARHRATEHQRLARMVHLQDVLESAD